MEHTKDYGLLRPFDPKAAEAGEPVMQMGGSLYPIRWVGRSANRQANIIERQTVSGVHHVEYAIDAWLRMAPLCWVEGKPVYKGEKMWRKDGQWTYAHEIVGKTQQEDDGLGVLLQVTEQGTTWSENLTWTPPKVRREGWVNIVGRKGGSRETSDRIIRNADIFDDEAKAKSWAGHCGDVIACVRIEWEE